MISGKPGAYRKKHAKLCTSCGMCAFMCPPFAHRSVADSPQDVQRQVRGYLDGDPPTEAVVERSRLCNECCKCVRDTCPRELDPMRANQLLRGLLHDDGTDPRPFVPPSDAGSSERIAAALLTTEAEYSRITTPAVKGDARILFFPGCNIYYQPHLLLTAMDILDEVTDGWTFLPGLSHCCGSNHDSAGRLEAGSEAMRELVSALAGSASLTAVVWCSTCRARLSLAGHDLPVISFARFLAHRLEDLPGARAFGVGIALQDPCKDAYLGMDTGATRDVLSRLTGEPVREMARHGRDTVCCGWALHQHRPEAWEESHKERLAEAKSAGAGILATVCHGCQWIMDTGKIPADVRTVNLVQLVGEAMGITHRERSRELRQAVSPDAAFHLLHGEMGERMERLPFGRDRILQTVELLRGGFSGA